MGAEVFAPESCRRHDILFRNGLRHTEGSVKRRAALLNAGSLFCAFTRMLCRRPRRGQPPTIAHAVGSTIPAPFNGRDLSRSLSPRPPFPSSFHLHSLHDDDTPAMLSWQQLGLLICLVARQLTSPIRGTQRYRAGDKQISGKKKCVLPSVRPRLSTASFNSCCVDESLLFFFNHSYVFFF